jgi:hypothetical protein
LRVMLLGATALRVRSQKPSSDSRPAVEDMTRWWAEGERRDGRCLTRESETRAFLQNKEGPKRLRHPRAQKPRNGGNTSEADEGGSTGQGGCADAGGDWAVCGGQDAAVRPWAGAAGGAAAVAETGGDRGAGADRGGRR